jgi:DNA repair photolyase
MITISPKEIFMHEKSINTKIGYEVLKAHSTAKVISIKHNTKTWNGTYNSTDPKDRFREKKNKLAVLHREAKWVNDFNGRSTDYLPNYASVQGCGFGCSYCYTDRNYLNNFPKVYDDAFKVVDLIKDTMNNLDPNHVYEKDWNPKHKDFITFDLGCDSDCVLDNTITRNNNYEGHIIDIMNQCSIIPNVMTSFATKSANINQFVQDINIPEHHRIRFSLMPEHHRKILELNTAPIIDRLHAANTLVDKGFEVHLNLSPIVATRDIRKEYRDLLQLIDNTLSDKAKEQMSYEIIFLTHSKKMYEPIQACMPKAHNMLTTIPLTPKWNKPTVLSYSQDIKAELKLIMQTLISEITPYSNIRYMF